jgi:hypothetical protein
MWRDGEAKREHHRNRPFGRSALGPKGGLLADLAESLKPNGNVRPDLQELGTIEAGSKVEITVSWKE